MKKNKEHLARETSRIEAFSDGVFAIAMTLLVLDLKVPHSLNGNIPLLQALASEWPIFAAYLTSFATIGIMWMSHHYLFTVIHRSDHWLFLINLFLLLLITFVPFPTSMVAEYIGKSAENAASALYSGTFFIIALAFQFLWRHASKNRRLIGESVDESIVRGITSSYRFGPPLYLAAFILSFINVIAAMAVTFGLAIFFAIPPKKPAKSPLLPSR